MLTMKTVLSVLFLGTVLFQGTTGFGMSLLCIPILAALTEPRTAIECVTVAALGTTTTIAYTSTR